MREWKLWDWIAYVSLVLAAVGVGAHAIFAENHQLEDHFPPWSMVSYWSFAPLALVALASCILIVRAFFPVSDGFQRGRPAATLSLQMFAPPRFPDRVAAKNVWRWYFMQNEIRAMDPAGTQQTLGHLTTLFICFDQPIDIGSWRVLSADIPLPMHAMREFTNRFAILHFEGALAPGTLNVEFNHS